MNQKTNAIARRDVLKLGLAGGAALTVLQFSPNGSGGTHEANAPKWGMLIDTDLCIGCRHCIKACQAHNDTAPGVEWGRIIETEAINGVDQFLPVPCQHCEHAACVEACPVKATYHRPDGIVMMDYDRCIGCRYCEVACPYGARYFNWEAFEGPNPQVPEWGEPEVARRPRGVVEKCSFCYQRIDRGLAQGLTPGEDPDATPACVAACPTGARLFGDLNDPDSAIRRKLDSSHTTRLRADMGTSPRVYYVHAAKSKTEVTS